MARPADSGSGCGRAAASLMRGDQGVDEGGWTADRLLGGRLLIRQPRHGYRAAIDPVLLAAAVPAGGGACVLEAGTGVGAASLCLGRRAPGITLLGLEIDPATAALARANVALNGLEGAITIVEGDLLAPPPEIRARSFEWIMSNPPHHPASAPSSPDARKALANREGIGIAAWLRACLRRLRPGGRLALIQRADRLPEVLGGLGGLAGEIEIVPLWPKEGRPAKRVLMRCRKGAKGPARLVPGLVLHGADGKYTAKAEAILRDGADLDSVLQRG